MFLHYGSNKNITKTSSKIKKFTNTCYAHTTPTHIKSTTTKPSSVPVIEATGMVVTRALDTGEGGYSSQPIHAQPHSVFHVKWHSQSHTSVTNRPSHNGKGDTILTTPKQKRMKKGNQKYIGKDFDEMMDVVAEVLPIGKTEWSVVVQRCNQSTSACGQKSRDIDSRQKILKEAGELERKTGDRSCPIDVRHAKQNARDILQKENAVAVGNSREDNAEGKDTWEENHDHDPQMRRLRITTQK